jgi:hypothetical protein
MPCWTARSPVAGISDPCAKAMTQTAFYTAANSAHFPGVVALLNSLRLIGHRAPIVLLDAGLSEEQRARLAPHVRLIEAPPGVPPVFLAPYGPMLEPATVAILLDADVIVTRLLGELIEQAQRGRLIAVTNDPPNDQRFFPDWRIALSLGELRRRPYVNAGLLVVPGEIGARIYGMWADGQRAIGMAASRYGRGRLDEPFYFADQDVLNAVLSAELADAEMIVLEHRLAPHPPFAGLELVDEGRLLCRFADGVEPFALHHTLGKPWLGATPANVYSRLLSRLLLGPDVALRLEPEELPLRLRRGVLAGADRRRATAQAVIFRQARRQLGRFGIRSRLAEWRLKRVAREG